jgi:hypothetical protein
MINYPLSLPTELLVIMTVCPVETQKGKFKPKRFDAGKSPGKQQPRATTEMLLNKEEIL